MYLYYNIYKGLYLSQLDEVNSVALTKHIINLYTKKNKKKSVFYYSTVYKFDCA